MSTFAIRNIDTGNYTCGSTTDKDGKVIPRYEKGARKVYYTLEEAYKDATKQNCASVGDFEIVSFSHGFSMQSYSILKDEDKNGASR